MTSKKNESRRHNNATAGKHTPGSDRWHRATYRYTINDKTTPEEINRLWAEHRGNKSHTEFHVNTSEDEDGYRNPGVEDPDLVILDHEWWFGEGSGWSEVYSLVDEEQLAHFLIDHADLFERVEQTSFGSDASSTLRPHFEEATPIIKDGKLSSHPLLPRAKTCEEGILIQLPRKEEQNLRSWLSRAGFRMVSGCSFLRSGFLLSDGQDIGLRAEIELGVEDVIVAIKPLGLPD